MNINLNSASLCWGPWEEQPGRDGLWAGNRGARPHASSIHWRAWQIPALASWWALPGKVPMLEGKAQKEEWPFWDGRRDVRGKLETEVGSVRGEIWEWG